MNDAKRHITPAVCDRLSPLFRNMDGSASVVAYAPIAARALLELDCPPGGILIIQYAIRVINSAIKAFLVLSAEKLTGK